RLATKPAVASTCKLTLGVGVAGGGPQEGIPRAGAARYIPTGNSPGPRIVGIGLRQRLEHPQALGPAHKVRQVMRADRRGPGGTRMFLPGNTHGELSRR